MLPFQSIQEAEASFGRNLTFAETLWFKYSSEKSDYFLYCHNTLFLFLFYTLLPLPYVIAELLRSKKVDKFKIQPKVNNSSSDMFKCYKNVMLVFFFAVGPVQLFSFPVIQRIGIRTGLPLPSGSEMILQLLVYVLVEDYSNYWLHRLLHCKWGYEKIHRVHHEYTAPIGFAAPYAHWAEVLILGFASFLGPLIVPGHMITFWLWMILRQMEAIETHSGYDFPWSPSKYIPFYGGAEYHDYHHFVGGLSQSNFASVFTYCDYLYGTDKGYRYQKEVFGKDLSLNGAKRGKSCKERSNVGSPHSNGRPNAGVNRSNGPTVRKAEETLRAHFTVRIRFDSWEKIQRAWLSVSQPFERTLILLLDAIVKIKQGSSSFRWSCRWAFGQADLRIWIRTLESYVIF